MIKIKLSNLGTQGIMRECNLIFSTVEIILTNLWFCTAKYVLEKIMQYVN